MARVLALPCDPARRDLMVNRFVERFTKIGLWSTEPTEPESTDRFAGLSARGMPLSHKRTAQRQLWQERERNSPDIPELRRM